MVSHIDGPSAPRSLSLPTGSRVVFHEVHMRSKVARVLSGQLPQ